MRRLLTCVVLCLLCPIFLFGCGARRSDRVIRSTAGRYALFNPRWTPPAAPVTMRRAWPTAFAGYRVSEQVTFREVVIDRQRRQGSGDDDYYRRVESTRSRRGYR